MYYEAQRAFSLLELLVVVALLSILSIAGVTSYRSHVISSSIAALLPLSGAAQKDVEIAHNEGEVFGSGSSKTYVQVSDLDKPKGLQSITQVDYGCIDIVVDLAGLNLDGSKSLIMTLCPRRDLAQTMVRWSCGYDVASDSGYVEYLPVECQQARSAIVDTDF